MASRFFRHLSKELRQEYGNGFSVPSLLRMMQLAERSPDEQSGSHND